MENLIISFEVVFPLFAMMAIGYLLKRLSILSEDTSTKMNKVVFRVFLPCMLFKNIYDSSLSEGFNYNLIWWSVSFIIVVFVAAVLIVPRFATDRSRAGVIVQGIFRSNFVIYGVPLSISLLGETNVGVTAILIAVVVPLYNLLAILSFQIFGKAKLNIKSFLLGLVKNPLIIASVLGLIALWFKYNFIDWTGIEFQIPALLYDTIGTLGKVTTPLSFVLLGATFKFSSARANIKALSIVVVLRLVILPVIACVASALMGFRGIDMVTLLVLFSTPNAISSYTMAQEMGGDYNLAGEIVVFTSALSIATLFILIFAFKQAGLF